MQEQLFIASAESSANPVEITAPRTYDEAVRQGWQDSIRKEMDCLMKNGTWTLSEPPESGQVVKCKWVFKFQSNGTMKSRLVACRYSQRANVDFFDTYAPTLEKATLRVFLSEGVQRQWDLVHWDVETAFLNSSLQGSVFMHQPEDFHDGSGRVLKLCKTIYGLKQSPRAWYLTLRNSLEKFGLTGTDPFIFFPRNY
jgi:hypothetical protein